MNKFRTSVAVFVLSAVVIGAPLSVIAQTSFASAEVAIEAATEILGDKTIETADPETLRRIKEIIDRIIDDFPASDLAVQILLQDTIGKLNIAALDRRLASLPPQVADTAPEGMVDVEEPESVDNAALEPQQPAEANEALAAIAAAEAQAAAVEEAAKQTALDELTAATESAVTEAQAAAEAGRNRLAALAEARRVAALADLVAEAQAREAQLAADEARLRATNFNASRFPASLRLLASKLNGCFVSTRRDIYRGAASVKFKIGSDGRVEGVPELQNADYINRTGRMIYVNISAALLECGIFQRQYANRFYDVTFNGTEMVRLSYGSSPEPAWVVASEDAQKELHLERKDIAEIQARLTVLEFDPNGIDGVFGRGTRAAISAWQEANDIPVSGYLDARQLAKLKEMRDLNFQQWLSTDNNQAILDRAARPRSVVRSNPRGWWRDSRGLYCRRAFLGSTWCQANRPRR